MDEIPAHSTYLSDAIIIYRLTRADVNKRHEAMLDVIETVKAQIRYHELMVEKLKDELPAIIEDSIVLETIQGILNNPPGQGPKPFQNSGMGPWESYKQMMDAGKIPDFYADWREL
jgi:hypothetical protein